MSDSSEPNIGSPKPGGTFIVTDLIIPPNESPFFLALRILYSIFVAVFFEGHLTTLE